LLKIAKNEFNNCFREVQQSSNVGGSRLVEKRNCLLDESSKRILWRLIPGENWSLVENNVNGFGRDGHNQTARCTLDLFE